MGNVSMAVLRRAGVGRRGWAANPEWPVTEVGVTRASEGDEIRLD